MASRNPLAFTIPEEMRPNVTWRPIDMDSTNWDDLVADADIVHHYAWSSIPSSANHDPGKDLVQNVGMTIKVLDALVRRRNGVIIFASSGGTVYGRLRETHVTEEHTLAPITAYGTSKATAELYLRLYRAMSGVDCRIVRISNPYGAGQDIGRGLGAISTFINRAIRNEPITIWGTGDVVRDYIHVSDVANCLSMLALAPFNEEFLFNVGSGVGYSLNSIVHQLEQSLGRELIVNRTQTRSFDVPSNILSIKRVNSVLGWYPRIALRQGIENTITDISSGRYFSTEDFKN